MPASGKYYTELSLGTISFHFRSPLLRTVLLFFTFSVRQRGNSQKLSHTPSEKKLLSCNPLTSSDSWAHALNHFVRNAISHAGLSCIPLTARAPSISWPEFLMMPTVHQVKSGSLMLGLQACHFIRALHCWHHSHSIWCKWGLLELCLPAQWDPDFLNLLKRSSPLSTPGKLLCRSPAQTHRLL